MSYSKQEEQELFRQSLMRKAQEARRLGTLPPIAGGDDDEEESETDGGEEESETDGADDEGEAGGRSSGEEEGGEEDAGSGGGPGDFPWDEFNRLKREQSEMAKRAKAAEREAKRQREKERRESGQYDEIIQEKEDEAQQARLEAEAAQTQLETFIRTQRVERIAAKMGFKDPADATMFIHADDTDDDSSTERALRRIAREKPYLVDRARATGAPVNGERGAGGLSFEDISKMSQEEINARWGEVQTALSNR